MEKTEKPKVVEILKETPTRLRDIEVYKYEFEFRVKVSYDEIIEALALEHGKGPGGARVKGKSSDKTADAALNYVNLTDSANRDISCEILDNLMALEAVQSRLEKYLSLLDAPLERVIRCVYFEKLPWRDTAKRVGMSIRTVQRLHNVAVQELEAMYSLIRISDET